MEVYVLYGSQTGNSEDIAKDIFTKCQEVGIPSTCSALNDIKKMEMKGRAKCLVIVCSTTGNGDAPENADGWWRQTKLRSAAKDSYANVPFAVLGLGDTNYDKFCHMGKSIDKRLAELGGRRVLDLYCADEATGLEETVEEWKVKIMEVLASVDSAECSTAAGDSTKSASVESKIQDADVATNCCAIGVLSIYEVAARCGLSDAIVTAPDSSQLPRSTKSGVNCHSLKIVEGGNHATEIVSQVEWCAGQPFVATIKSARWLTSHSLTEEVVGQEWGQTKRVVHMEVSLGQSGIRYSPGDSVGVICPNPRHLVESVFARLRDSHPEQVLALNSYLDGLVLPGTSRPCTLTLEEVLSYRVDLTSVPRKQSVINLAQHCKSEQEATMIRWLCSKGAVGKMLWGQFIEAQRVGLGELLALFPSCCPPLSALLAACSAQAPRFYSIACSPLMCPSSITVAFSSVRYYCSLDPSVATTHGYENKPPPRIAREGIATAYLESICQRWLRHGRDAVGCPADAEAALPTIRIFHKPTICFRLPGSVAVPLILVGPGTGVAPFIGFLKHREGLERERLTDSADECVGVWRGNFELGVEDLPVEGKSCAVETYIHSLQPGPILLFGGCRNESDYLFREELEARQASGTLTVLDVAMSRVGPEKVYVTHRLRARGAEIAKLLLQDGAAVYICGDGNHMAKDVYSTFKELLQTHGALSEDEAEQFLQSMKQRKRFVLDIWS